MIGCEVDEIRVPRESMNDDAVVIVKWHFEDGAEVRKGDIIVTVETSKATFDIEATADGYIFYDLMEKSEVKVGALIAVISGEKDFSLEGYSSSFGGGESDSKGNEVDSDEEDSRQPRFSKTALKIIEEKKIDKKIFGGRDMVRKDDVLTLLAELEKQDDKCSSDASSIMVGTSSGHRLVIFGGGGHAKICIDIIKQMRTYEIVGLIDDNIEAGEKVLGVPVLGNNDHLVRLYEEGVRLAINGIGSVNNPSLRGRTYFKLRQIGFYLPNIVHPSAAVEPSVIMGEGNQIMAHAVVGAAVRIRNNCIVNAGAIVSHDTLLNDNAHIAPGAVLAANISVGRNTLIGMGSTIYLGLNIGDGVVVFNGCNVTRDVGDGKVLRP